MRRLALKWQYLTAQQKYSPIRRQFWKSRKHCLTTTAAACCDINNMPLPPLKNPVPKPETIKTICVFCGANENLDPVYFEQAQGTTCSCHNVPECPRNT